MADKEGWSSVVTRRASVMTPLLIVNALILFFGTVIFLKNGSALLYVLWFPVAGFSAWKYEHFSKTAPWLLSSQKVALKGMELFGDSKNNFSHKEVIDLNPVSNPEAKAVSAPKSERS